MPPHARATTRQRRQCTPSHKTGKVNDRKRDGEKKSKIKIKGERVGERLRVIKVHKEYHFNNIKQTIQVGFKWYA